MWQKLRNQEATPGWLRSERLCPHRAIVRVEGDLTHAETVNEFARAVRSSFAHPRTQKMLLDLRQVRQVDSKLVAALIAMNRMAQRRSIELIIRPSALLRRWLLLYRVERMLRPPRSTRSTARGSYRCCRRT